MTSLVACLGEGRGTWAGVAALLKESWEAVYIVCPKFVEKSWKGSQRLIVLDENMPIEALVAQLAKEFEGRFFGDVAVNFVSGSGKLHMAVLAALLRVGAGIRLVVADAKGVKEL